MDEVGILGVGWSRVSGEEGGVEGRLGREWFGKWLRRGLSVEVG